MENVNYTDLEKEMLNFDFRALEAEVAAAKTSLSAGADRAAGLQKLCEVWRKIRKYIKALEVIPVIGKFVTIFAGLMDSICPE